MKLRSAALGFTKFIAKIRGKSRRKAGVAVLMYHRIATPASDPWQLSVSPQNFEEQLQLLQSGYSVIAMKDLPHLLKENDIPEGSVCISFDDAYTDNFLAAKPLLEKYNVPATFFIPSSYIGKTTRFWWDELELILLHAETLPASLQLNINNQKLEFNFGNQKLSPGDKELHAKWIWPEQAPTLRCKYYLEIWELLRPLTLDQIEEILKQISTWSGTSLPVNASELPMTLHQLQQLNSNSLFSLGLHTCTHPDLASHSVEVQKKELLDNRQYLQTNFGNLANAIAYPYGRYNMETVGVLKDLKVDLAFTTQEAMLTRGSSLLEAGRFQATNLDGKDFKHQLQEWFSHS